MIRRQLCGDLPRRAHDLLDHAGTQNRRAMMIRHRRLDGGPASQILRVAEAGLRPQRPAAQPHEQHGHPVVGMALSDRVATSGGHRAIDLPVLPSSSKNFRMKCSSFPSNFACIAITAERQPPPAAANAVSASAEALVPADSHDASTTSRSGFCSRPIAATSAAAETTSTVPSSFSSQRRGSSFTSAPWQTRYRTSNPSASRSTIAARVGLPSHPSIPDSTVGGALIASFSPASASVFSACTGIGASPLGLRSSSVGLAITTSAFRPAARATAGGEFALAR